MAKNAAGRPNTSGRQKNARASAAAAVQARVAKEAFLAQYRAVGNVSGACRAAKVGRTTVYDWQKADADFRAAFADAELEATDLLEQECRRRALVGVEEPVYQGGAKVGTVRKYSDVLLIFLLKAKRPTEFRDRVEHTGKGGKPIESTTTVRFGGRYKPAGKAQA